MTTLYDRRPTHSATIENTSSSETLSFESRLESYKSAVSTGITEIIPVDALLAKTESGYEWSEAVDTLWLGLATPLCPTFRDESAMAQVAAAAHESVMLGSVEKIFDLCSQAKNPADSPTGHSQINEENILLRTISHLPIEKPADRQRCALLWLQKVEKLNLKPSPHALELLAKAYALMFTPNDGTTQTSENLNYECTKYQMLLDHHKKNGPNAAIYDQMATLGYKNIGGLDSVAAQNHHRSHSRRTHITTGIAAASLSFSVAPHAIATTVSSHPATTRMLTNGNPGPSELPILVDASAAQEVLKKLPNNSSATPVSEINLADTSSEGRPRSLDDKLLQLNRVLDASSGGVIPPELTLKATEVVSTELPQQKLQPDTQASVPPSLTNRPKTDQPAASPAEAPKSPDITPSPEKAASNFELFKQNLRTLCKKGIPDTNRGGITISDAEIDRYAKLFWNSAANAKDPYITPQLLAAIAFQESNLNPKAGSPAGAVGIMQIMPATAIGLRLDPSERTDPSKAIPIAAKLLSDNHRSIKQKFGNDPRYELWMTLAAYNTGPGNVNKYGRVVVDDISYAGGETYHYVRNIEKALKLLTGSADSISYEVKKTASTAENPRTSGGTELPREINGHSYYSQHDARWATIPYTLGDPSSTIKTSGCGPTSMAALIKDMTGNNVDPDTLATLFIKSGALTPAGTSHSGFTLAANKYGLSTKQIPYTIDGVSKALKDGKRVVIGSAPSNIDDPRYPQTTGGHVFWLSGITEDGKFLLSDPNNSELSKQPVNPSIVFRTGGSAYAISK